jgi:hypothetical protein
LNSGFDYYKQVAIWFDAHDWNGVIKARKAIPDFLYENFIKRKFPVIRLMISIAQANIDNDYLELLFLANWGNYSTKIDNFTNHYIDENIAKSVLQTSLYIGKQLFEKANGRIITDTELTQLHVNVLEKSMADDINNNYINSAWTKREK